MTTNPQNVVAIDCGNFLVRSTTIDDASDRWARWMVDPRNLRLVNSSPKAMTRADVAAYIRKFDQRSHLLLSIFEKQSGLQIGSVASADPDPLLNGGAKFTSGHLTVDAVRTGLSYKFN